MIKRKLADLANRALQPLGLQIYHDGLDMESVLRRLAARDPNVASVIDIGASTGRWSAMTAPMFPNTRFVGVDPLQEREPDLRALKQRQPRFDYVLCVAGEKEHELVQMAVSDDLDGSTVGGGAEHGLTMRQVPSRSVDAIAAMKDLRGPFLLKFDTHGFEVPILKGATKTLEQTHYIVMETYNYRHVPGTLLFWEMCALLDGMGFRCFNLVDPMQRPADRSLWQMDLFFARRDNAVFRHDSFRQPR
jgi:FkbM family methyltransferase